LQRRFASDEKVPVIEAATTDETVSEKPSEPEAQTIAESSSQPLQQPETETLGTSTTDTPEAPIDAAPEGTVSLFSKPQVSNILEKA